MYNSPQKKRQKMGNGTIWQNKFPYIHNSSTLAHTHTRACKYTRTTAHTDMTHVTDAHTHTYTDRLPKISATWLLRPRQRRRRHRHRRLYRLIVSHIDRDGAESARHLRYNTPTPHPRPTVYQSPVTLIPTVPDNSIRFGQLGSLGDWFLTSDSAPKRYKCFARSECWVKNYGKTIFNGLKLLQMAAMCLH